MADFVPNLRDVGGMTTDGGSKVRSGRVLRSAMPDALDIAPHTIEWPPALVIDLRSPGESDPVHPLAGDATRVLNLPLLQALRPDVPPQATLHDLYLLLLESASGYLVELVREVTREPGATLIHCAAGKDRTGVSIALLLRLIGVSREQIVADYVLTEGARDAITARLSTLPGHERRATLPAAFFSVSPDAINAVLDVWDDHEGGVEGWFRVVGGDDEDVRALTSALVG